MLWFEEKKKKSPITFVENQLNYTVSLFPGDDYGGSVATTPGHSGPSPPGAIIVVIWLPILFLS